MVHQQLIDLLFSSKIDKDLWNIEKKKKGSSIARAEKSLIFSVTTKKYGVVCVSIFCFIFSDFKGGFLKSEMISLKFREIIKSTKCLAKKYLTIITKIFYDFEKHRVLK